MTLQVSSKRTWPDSKSANVNIYINIYLSQKWTGQCAECITHKHTLTHTRTQNTHGHTNSKHTWTHSLANTELCVSWNFPFLREMGCDRHYCTTHSLHEKESPARTMETNPRLRCTPNTQGGRKKEQEEQNTETERQTDQKRQMDRQIFSSNNDFGEMDK